SEYGDSINSVIQDTVNHKVQKQVELLEATGLIAPDINGKDNIVIRSGTSSGSDFFRGVAPELVMYDYIINSMIGYKDIQTIFAGDLAGYFKGSDFSQTEHVLPKVRFN